MDNVELFHWGIKGMKWGVRRYQNEDGTLTEAGKKRYSKSESNAKSTQKKSAKKMTEEELRERIARLQLEKQYKSLNKETMARGKAFALDVLEASGRNIATQLTTYVMGVAVNKGAEALGVKNATKTVKDAAGVEMIQKCFEDIVNPRKGQKDK